MSNTLRRIKKLTDYLEGLKEPIGIEFNELSQEERDIYWLDFLIKVAKMENSIPDNWKNPIYELAQQIRNKLKCPDKTYSPSWSEEERRERILRLINMIRSDNKIKAIWEYYIKDIVYPF